MDPSVLIDIVEPAARVLLVVQRLPATDLPASGFYAEYVHMLAMSDGSRPFVDRDKDRFQNLKSTKIYFVSLQRCHEYTS